MTVLKSWGKELEYFFTKYVLDFSPSKNHILGINPYYEMVQFLGYLEAYLSHSIKTVDFAEFLSGLEVACHAEYDGSFLYKYVEILVGVGTFENSFLIFFFSSRGRLGIILIRRGLC